MPIGPKPPTERIPAKAWARTPKVVRVEMVALVQELADVKARLAKAEEQLRRNSRNSSQPPSQDKAEQKAPAEPEQGRVKRRRGGQLGHAGHRRLLLRLTQSTRSWYTCRGEFGHPFDSDSVIGEARAIGR